MAVWLPVLCVSGLAVPVLAPLPSNASVRQSPEEAPEGVWPDERIPLWVGPFLDGVDAELLENRIEEADNELWKAQKELYVEIDELDNGLDELRSQHDEYDDKLLELREWVKFLDTRVQRWCRC